MFFVRLLLMSALSATASPSARVEILEPPVRMKANLSTAMTQIHILGECAELHPDLGIEEDFEKRQVTYLSNERNARSIWGNLVQPDYGSSRDRPVSCSKRNVTAALREADRAFATHRELFSKATATMARGAWVGPLKLCQTVVKQATIGSDTMRHQPILEIELDREAWPVLAEITTRAVNGELAVRMNGRIILQPRVHEPLESGRLDITGPDLETLKAVQLELGNAC